MGSLKEKKKESGPRGFILLRIELRKSDHKETPPSFAASPVALRYVIGVKTF